MLEFSGKSVFEGIAIGKIRVFRKKQHRTNFIKITDAEQEIVRFCEAQRLAVGQLEAFYEKALQEVGEKDAAIFEAQRLLLSDAEYAAYVESVIRLQAVNAEYAVAAAENHFVQIFDAMEDEYMRARAADVTDISERLLEILAGESAEKLILEEPSILVAEDLTPTETIQMDKANVLAFVTAQGSVSSHTAILARSLGIPALVGADISLEGMQDGKQGIVDGVSGVFYVEPTETVLAAMKAKHREEAAKRDMLQALKGKEDVTLDGKKIKLYANIGNINELAMVQQNDAKGIGLLRSEFIFLERDSFPTEEEQFQIYKSVAEAMNGKPVIIRTLDIGADKQCDYFKTESEDNPALGYRGIRISLTHTEIFKTQLRALFRAGAYGNIAVMYPMIISVNEVHQIQKIVAEVKAELTAKGAEYGELKQGIMIETPAAVMISDELAKEVDFFSIGTNDLAQYTLAIDRQNPKLERFYEEYHPAVLKMISMVVENAHREGIWAGICGELAADTRLTKRFLAMGVDELSVSPRSILPIRKIILETDTEA